MNIVIMAGGGGTRLWPLSRTDNPKQFLTFGGDKTLLELAYERACAVTAPSHIYIATVEEYRDKTRKVLPSVADDHIFFEPARRDTAAAFAAVCAQLVLLGEESEPTVFMWADHVFTAEENYIRDIKKIPAILKSHPDAIALIGHTPLYPETGFGYIEVGDPEPGYDDVFRVAEFKEKPDRETAERYVSSGAYYWNMGAISARPARLIELLRTYEPSIMEAVDAFGAALTKGDTAAAKKAYANATATSIDYAVLERTDEIYVITGDYGWSDVGNWAAVKDIFGNNGDHVPSGHHVHVDSANNYIYNTTTKAVCLIGTKDSIVVVTDDAVLITHKDQAHRVKDVVKDLQKAHRAEYL